MSAPAVPRETTRIDPKLLELRPEFRPKIATILDELTTRGYQPHISNAYRSEAQQQEKIRLGYAMPGSTAGTHEYGLACDIVDIRWLWRTTEENAKFFAALCDLATGAGLTSGGTWFGKGGTRQKPTHKSPWNKWGLGWDVAHVDWHDAPEELRRPYPPGARG